MKLETFNPLSAEFLNFLFILNYSLSEVDPLIESAKKIKLFSFAEGDCVFTVSSGNRESNHDNPVNPVQYIF